MLIATFCRIIDRNVGNDHDYEISLGKNLSKVADSMFPIKTLEKSVHSIYNKKKSRKITNRFRQLINYDREVYF